MRVWGRWRERMVGFVGARLIKTAIAVSLSTGLMSFWDTTHGLVGAGVCSCLMIAPDEDLGKTWGRHQFMAALVGAAMGALIGRFVGWAPWLSGISVVALILVYRKLGYTEAILGGVANMLFILEHADKGNTYAFFRFTASVVGLVFGYLVNRFVLPYRPQERSEQSAAVAE